MIKETFNKICGGIGLVMIIFLSFFSVTHAQTLAPLNGSVPVDTTSMNSSNINTYRDYCVNDGDSNDTFEGAYYVTQTANPSYYAYYSASNSSWNRRILDSSTVFVYNPATFGNNGSFSFLSNVVPNGSTIYATKIGSPNAFINNTVGRTNVAAMYAFRGNYQTMIKNGANNNSPFGFRTTSSQPTATPFNFNLNVVNNPVENYSCNRYYVAKCGDGVVDNTNKPGGANTDGKQGINTVNGFVPRFVPGGIPAETCDDGNLNGQDGHCNNTCNGTVPVPQPVCNNVTINPNNIFPGQSTAISCNGTNATSYALHITGPSVNNNYTTQSITYTPITYGTYNVACTVFGANGTTPSTCQSTLNVINNSPVCENFTATPTTVGVGQPVTLFCDGNQYSNTFQILVQQGNSLVASFNGGLPGPLNTTTSTWTPNAPGTYTTQCAVSNNNTQVAYCPQQIVVVGQPSLWVNKVANQPGVSSGGQISFTITFGNSGNSVANNVTIQDILPASLQYVSHTLAGIPGGTSFGGQTIFGYSAGFSGLTLQPGQSGTMTITATYVSNTCTSGIVNYATVYNQSSQANDTATFDCIPPQPAVISLDKKQHVTGSPTDAIITVQSGNTITYTIVVTNTGGSIMTGLYLEDVMPSGITYINSTISGIPGLTSSAAPVGNQWVVSSSVFALAPGQTITWIITGTVTTGSGSFLNTAFVKNIAGNIIAQDSVLAIGVGPALTLDKYIINQQAYYMPGDTIVYGITFTNQGSGAAFNVVLQDIIPGAVTYGTSSISGVSATFGQQNVGGTITIYYNNFTLNPGQTVTVIVTGTVNNNISNNTLNTAILQSSNHPTLTDTADFISQPLPTIQKYQQVNGPFTQNQITVNIGDIINYQVIFSNVGGSTATGVVITDYLPLGVTYTNSTLNVPYTTTTTNVIAGQTVITYNGITLAPGQQAVLNVTAQISSNTVAQYINTAKVEFFNPYQTASSSVVAVRIPGANVVFTKNLVGSGVYVPGDTVNFTLNLTNNGPDPISNITLQDIWPSCLNFVSRTSNPNLTQTSTTSPYAWTYPQLTAGQMINMNLVGTVKNDPNCAGVHYNTGRATYTIGNNQYTLERVVSFQVNIPQPAQCQNMTTNTSVIMLDNNTTNGGAQLTCTTANNVVGNIRIDCGNGTSSPTVSGSSLTYTCQYNHNDIGQSFNTQCIVNGVTNPINSCQKIITIDQGSFGFCGNGIREGYEQCDITSSSWANGFSNNHFIIGHWLDNGYTSASSQYAGSYCQNCAIRNNDQPFIYQPPACFYSNTTISIQKGEVLPFRWNLQRDDTRITNGSTCTRPNSIPVETMICEFSIYRSDLNNPIYNWKTPCLQDSWNDEYFDFFKNAPLYADSNNALGRYYYPIGNNLTRFGEYKLTLESVEYEYCDENQHFVQDPQIVDRVCQVNFAVTRPYLVQKSAFSNVPQTTTIDLHDFYAIDGTPLSNGTDLANIMILNASQYSTPSADTSIVTNNFINKYKQLAVTITDPSINNLFSNAGQIKVSKVPGQQIYVFESQGASRITLKELQTFTKPFTMVIIGMDLVVQGSMTTTNGMFLVQNGRISFREPDTNACATRQTVNGVFITNKGFGVVDPANEIIINNTFGKERCNEGGLTVKGVLIGPDLDKLVLQRRSQLNTWFQVTSNSESAIRAEKRNKVFDGAAVLIEYNPALREHLPPGMSDFTQVLDVYKQ